MSSSEAESVNEKLKRKRPHRDEDSNDEADYERNPRRQRVWVEEARQKTCLPVVLPTGETIIPESGSERKPKKALSNATTKDSESGNDIATKISKKQSKRLDEAKRLLEQKEKAFEAKKAAKKQVASTKESKINEEVKKILGGLRSPQQKLTEIVNSSELIISSPEDNLFRFDVLFSLISEASQLPQISTIAIISLGSVFKNILPGYKIHSHSDHKEHNKLSRVIEKLYEYETKLVSYYSKYVGFLQAKAFDIPNIIGPIVCELLYASPSFNYSDEILDLCIRFACLTPVSTKLVNIEENKEADNIATRAAQCLVDLIKRDSTLDLAVRIARVVGKVAKNSSKSNNSKKNKNLKMNTLIHGSLLGALSKLDFADKEASVRREATLRGINENDKISKEVLKDLQASSIYGDIKKFKKNQNEILKELFVIFLRVLRTPSLFPVDALEGSLEGLGRLSYLVNVELVEEISLELKNLLITHKFKLNPFNLLEGIIGAIRLTKISGSTIHVDVSWVLNEFILILDELLPHLIAEKESMPIINLPFSIFKTKNKIDDFVITELHPDDHSLIVYRIKEVIELILTTPSICGNSFGTSNEAVLKLIESLLNLSCHLADPICRITILKQLSTILEKYPNLGTALGIEGTILYQSGDEISLYWTTELLSSFVGKNSTTNSFIKKIKSCAEN